MPVLIFTIDWLYWVLKLSIHWKEKNYLSVVNINHWLSCLMLLLLLCCLCYRYVSRLRLCCRYMPVLDLYLTITHVLRGREWLLECGKKLLSNNYPAWSFCYWFLLFLYLHYYTACLFVWLSDFWTSSSATRLYRGRVPTLTSGNFTCCHTRDRAGRPWLLSQPVTLYWHQLNQ